ncbi:MAG: cryptochrome/photolyase family protein [Planctomycetota bacterium]
MGAFTDRLDELNSDLDAEGRSFVYVPYDQCTDACGPLSRLRPSEAGIVMVECPEKAERRPYHKQKLALVLATMRHFALEQAERGVFVRYLVADGSYAGALEPVAREVSGLVCMEPAERELRVDLRPLVDGGLLTFEKHEGFLTTAEQFERSVRKPPYRMDAFYRVVRQDTGLLMDGGKPLGGKYSFDAHNREPWKGEPEPAEPPRFRANEITQEVGQLIESRFSDHPGVLDLQAIPASRAQVDRMYEWAKSECLPRFGPHEDAMTLQSRNLFHTRLSPLLHLHRILPRQVVDDLMAMDLELPSKEGFLRQLIGWREFMRHVHRATDGFRELPESLDVGDRESPNHLRAERPLPAAFWEGTESGLHCLDHVVESVWDEGYSHHITRLMVLSNLATLLDVDPGELNEWFWVAYTDAYDWVVEPNVLGMGSFALGDLFTTKPYVSGSAYIHKMSDFCSACVFHPKKTCPITHLYWAFLGRHEKRFEGNQRLAMPLRSLNKRADEQRQEDRRVFEQVSDLLSRGEILSPELLAEDGAS